MNARINILQSAIQDAERRIGSNPDDRIYVADQQAKIKVWSDELAELLDAQKSVTGKPTLDVAHGVYNGEHYVQIAEHLDNGTYVDGHGRDRESAIEDFRANNPELDCHLRVTTETERPYLSLSIEGL